MRALRVLAAMSESSFLTWQQGEDVMSDRYASAMLVPSVATNQ
jgi:hypothetical protein